MNEFVFHYLTKVYFGKKAAYKHLRAELSNVSNTVILAYGSGSVKKNGIFSEMIQLQWGL